MKLWTPRKHKGDRAASVTQRGNVALRFEYRGKDMVIEVTPKLAAKLRDEVSECLEAIEFEARRQGEYDRFFREVQS